MDGSRQIWDEISIHALREEGDTRRSKPLTLPHYFYPRPPRGGRHQGHRQRGQGQEISIHALREEGDAVRVSGEP